MVTKAENTPLLSLKILLFIR